MFPKVVQVIPMENYSVYVYFEDGKIVCYDMTQMIEKEAFRPVKDITVFKEACTVMNDTLAWDIGGGGAEIIRNVWILTRTHCMSYRWRWKR